MIALPSDIGRAGPEVKAAYEHLLNNMAAMFQACSSERSSDEERERALGLVALCVGGMVLARTVNDHCLAHEIREAARMLALRIAG